MCVTCFSLVNTSYRQQSGPHTVARLQLLDARCRLAALPPFKRERARVNPHTTSSPEPILPCCNHRQHSGPHTVARLQLLDARCRLFSFLFSCVCVCVHVCVWCVCVLCVCKHVCVCGICVCVVPVCMFVMCVCVDLRYSSQAAGPHTIPSPEPIPFCCNHKKYTTPAHLLRA